MADDEFRLPGSSYDELIKIIMGYGHFDTDVTPADVGGIAGVHETQVSRNNAFLVAVGVVEGGRRKVISALGRNLALALQHNVLEDVSKYWHHLVAANSFFQKVLAAVRIRRGMDASTLQAHVAYSAGQKKSPAVVAGAAAVVQIMVVAGLLREEDGKYVAMDEGSASTPTPIEEAGVPDQATLTTTTVTRTATPVLPLPSTASAAALAIQLQLRVDCKVDELDAIAVKLRNLIRTLSEPSEPNPTPAEAQRRTTEEPGATSAAEESATRHPGE
ncbi:MAG TPA: hypothetical protein VGK32_23765 [Vicinamibacterales bacterium]|jgi:hypothetical protein